MADDMDVEPRQAVSTTMVLIQMARDELGRGRRASVDETLATSQRMLIRAGADDIGPVTTGRDLADDVNTELVELQRSIKRKDEEIKELVEATERQEATIESLEVIVEEQEKKIDRLRASTDESDTGNTGKSGETDSRDAKGRVSGLETGKSDAGFSLFPTIEQIPDDNRSFEIDDDRAEDMRQAIRHITHAARTDSDFADKLMQSSTPGVYQDIESFNVDLYQRLDQLNLEQVEYGIAESAARSVIDVVYEDDDDSGSQE